MTYLILGASLRGLIDAARIAVAEGAAVRLFDLEHDIDPSAVPGATILPRTWDLSYLDGVDRVIASPWFPETSGPVADALAAGVDVVTEAGFALERLTIPRVAVTGTNGKTTVATVTADMLAASAVPAIACGNVGLPVSAVSDGDADVLVLELSSYQLRFMRPEPFAAAALLNIAEDHLDWHGDVDAYVAAKARIFAGMAPNAVLAYNADDPVVTDVVASAGCVTVPCSSRRLPDGGNGVVGSHIVVDGHTMGPATADPSYLFDLVAAATVALAVGATMDGVASVVEAFTPGRHRRSITATVAGVTWINDSKATNPHAAVAAARSYRSVILLAGGRNKGLDLTPLARIPTVRTVIAFGEAGREIAAADPERVVTVPTMRDAIRKAGEIATSGDTVLLSPGCASFDEFASYAERGEVFEREVAAMQEGGV